MSSRTLSGSSRSPSSVDPAMSQNSTVARRRRAPSGPCKDAPQRPQNREPSGALARLRGHSGTRVAYAVNVPGFWAQGDGSRPLTVLALRCEITLPVTVEGRVTTHGQNGKARVSSCGEACRRCPSLRWTTSRAFGATHTEERGRDARYSGRSAAAGADHGAVQPIRVLVAAITIGRDRRHPRRAAHKRYARAF